MQANDPAVDDVLRGLDRVLRGVKQVVYADPVERAALVVLGRLRDADAARLTDLAADLGLDVSTVSRQVRALEERGLLERSTDADDRRAVRVRVAPAGYAVLDAAWTRRHDWLVGALADWSAADRSELATLLHRLADSLQTDREPSRRAPGGARLQTPTENV